MVTAISNLVGQVMEFLFQLTQAIHFPSYALALIILTIIIKVLLYPLNKKQMQSMKGVQEIQPMVNELNVKYANNPQKKQELMLELYQKHNINPMAGCLPLLVQMPILLLLYQGIRNFVPVAENMAYFGFFWIPNLSLPDPTWVFPILMAVTTFLQSFVSTGLPKDPTQKMMLYGMPLMMLWWGRAFPSGVCLYWIVFAIMGAIQQLILNKGVIPNLGTSAATSAKNATVNVKPAKAQPAKQQGGKAQPNGKKPNGSNNKGSKGGK